MTRVLFVVLDGQPTRHLSPEITPHLWALAGEAGQRPGRATGVMPAATYPNHATFVTGRPPVDHGILANWFFVDGRATTAESVGVDGHTLFDACLDAGRSSALVVGDQHLVGVVAGDRADSHWPPDGRVPHGSARDAKGYIADEDLVPRVAEAIAAGYDFVFAQVNGPDTVGHVFGPDAPEAIDGYRATDALVAGLRETMAESWSDTVAIVVSDHTMETLTHPAPLDAFTLASERGMLGLPDGGSALFQGDHEPAWLGEVEGCAGWEPVAPDTWSAWTEPGWWFAIAGLEAEYRGMHGNPTTLEQVALVSGGHPAARALAEQVAAGSVSALDWGPTVAGLLELSLPDAVGRDLLAS
ncbi:MAG TPA: alkaline phosphatase family protein [Acidimicrobiia bacterium]|nr:alkaline phosphatase family protein [Acidimicrobiia bacterium]